MNIIKSYFIKKYIKILLITIIFSITLIFILDFSEIIRNTSNIDGIRWSSNLIMVLSKSSKNLIQLMPLVVLIGTIATFMILNKRNELVVFTTLGIPNRFFILSILSVIIIFFCLILFILIPINTTLSLVNDNSNSMITVDKKGFFFKTSDNVFIRADKANYELTKLYNLIIWDLNDQFTLKEILTAPIGYIVDNNLILNDVTIERKLSKLYIDEKIISIDVSPADIFKNLSKPEQMTLFAIPSFSILLSKVGLSSESYERYFWDKVTTFINLFGMALIGFIVSFATTKRFFDKKKIFYGCAIGLLIFFTSDFFPTVALSYGLNVPVAIISSKLSILALIVLAKIIYCKYRF